MPPTDAATRTLLLVDAAPSLRTVAQLHLGREGYVILEAADEPTAFAILRGTRVDVAVCALPDARVDVAECLRRLRSAPERAFREVPVLLLASGAADLEELCAAHGPAAALRAPHTGPRLAQAVEQLLSRAR